MTANDRRPIPSGEGSQLLRNWRKDNSVLLLETFIPSTRQRREFLVRITNIFEGTQEFVLEVKTVDLPAQAFNINLTQSDFFMESKALHTVAVNGDEIAFSLSENINRDR